MGTCARCLRARATGGARPPSQVVVPDVGDTNYGDAATEMLSKHPAHAPIPPREPVAPDPQTVSGWFPQLEVLQVLGHGGMGIVYKAKQRALDRLVAVKLLLPGFKTSPDFSQRFAREARALARLNHQNIVAVYDFAASDDQYFALVMEFVDGSTLRKAMCDKLADPFEAIGVAIQVCDGLHYAHEEGVVHRDMKPDNILIDRRGRAKIADFGLVKLLSHGSRVDAALTLPEQAMGTLHYMSPEQLRSPLNVDRRTDIYSLGVVLYELLTGELPIGRFAPPSRYPGVDPRLDPIVFHALEPRPQDRYATCQELMYDLEGILRDRPATPGGRIIMRGGADLGTPAPGSGVVVNPPSDLTSQQTPPAPSDSQTELEPHQFVEPLDLVSETPKVEPEAKAEPAPIEMPKVEAVEQPVMERKAPEPKASPPVLKPEAPPPPRRPVEPAARLTSRYRRTIRAMAAMHSVENFDGALVYTADGLIIAALNNGRIVAFDRLLNPLDGKEYGEGGASADAMRISPDDARVIARRTDGRLELIELSSGRSIWSIAFPGVSWKPMGAFSNDGKQLAVAVPRRRGAATASGTRVMRGPGSEIHVYSAIDGSPLSTSPTPGLAMRSAHGIDWHGERIALADGGDDDATRGTLLWDPAAQSVAGRFTHPNHPPGGAAARFSPDGSTLAVAFRKNDVGLFDTKTNKYQRTLRNVNGTLSILEFSPNGKLLAATGPADPCIHVWDMSNGQLLAQLDLPSQTGASSIQSFAFDRTATTVVAGLKNAVAMWELELEPGPWSGLA